MPDILPEAYIALLAKTLKYFASTDTVSLTEEEKWVNTIAFLDKEGLNPFTKHSELLTIPSDKMLNLLRECLLTQRWEEVLKLITFISEYRTVNYILFKVGLELCHHLEECQGRYLEQLINHLLGPTALRPRQVTLEYMLFLLSVNLDTTDVESVVTILQALRRPTDRKKSESEQMILMFDAYRGLVWYVHWLQSKCKVEQFKNQSDLNMMEEVELSHEENKMKILCERALSFLQKIQDKPGIWDIFITKYIELLDWSDETEKIESVLTKYQSQNPHHPNACRYLLQYYRKKGNQDKSLSVLQMLCKLLPSDEAVLQLVSHHKQKNASPSVILPLLFDLLDYSCWKECPEPWSLLAEDLINVLQSEADASVEECFQTCWSARYQWWPKYHFDIRSLRALRLAPDVSRLLANKAAVAIIFGVAEDYVKEVKDMLASDKQHLELLDRAIEAARQLQVVDKNT